MPVASEPSSLAPTFRETGRIGAIGFPRGRYGYRRSARTTVSPLAARNVPEARDFELAREGGAATRKVAFF